MSTTLYELNNYQSLSSKKTWSGNNQFNKKVYDKIIMF